MFRMGADDGAVNALLNKKSLFAAGIKKVQGLTYLLFRALPPFAAFLWALCALVRASMCPRLSALAVCVPSPQ